MNDLLPLFFVAGIFLLILFTLTWLVQLRTKNAAFIDVVWSAGFPFLAMIYFILVDGYAPRQLLVLIMVCVWGFRLALYLYFRTTGQPEDARYTVLQKKWGKRQNLFMLRFCYFQALSALLLSLPFVLLMVNTTPSINNYEVTGLLLGFLAVAGESIADDQLRKFKQDPGNNGRILNRGLWRYSRHPNYFFEWLVWISFSVMALGSAWGFVAFISPALMYYFLTRVTGIAYTERQMLNSYGGAFEAYQKSTSAFFPWPSPSPPAPLPVESGGQSPG